MFSPEESGFLQELVEKHFYRLDTSLSRDSLELRNKAWQVITDEFNKSKVGDVRRDMNELKIKHKNMKAQRINFKAEGISGHSVIEQSYIETDPIPEESMTRSLRSKAPDSDTSIVQKDTPPRERKYQVVKVPARQPAKTKNYEALLEDTSEDFSDDDDVRLSLNKNLIMYFTVFFFSIFHHHRQ